MRRASVVALVLFCLATVRANQSTPSASRPTDAEIDQLLARFIETVDTYQRTFRNLVAEETKLAEQLKPSGEVNKRRVIVSDLVVYQPSKDPSARAVEYRDVVTVDGKPVKERSVRALEVLQRASQARSLERELQIIDRENQRYELNLRIVDAVINPIGGGGQKFRDTNRIDWVGRDRVDGHDVVVLDFRATTPRPESRRFFTNMGITALFTRGRVWIDVATLQLRRERWEVAGVHQTMPEPILVLRKDGAYTESRYGILTPHRLVFEWYERTGGTKQKPSMTLASRTTFTFGAFRQFEVTTEESISTPAAPAK